MNDSNFIKITPMNYLLVRDSGVISYKLVIKEEALYLIVVNV